MLDISSFGGYGPTILCRICNHVMKDAMCGPCGHSLCSPCMKDVLWESRPCPTCGVAIKLITPNFRLRTELARFPRSYSAIAQLEHNGTDLVIRCDEGLACLCMDMLLSQRSIADIARSLCTNYQTLKISCFIQYPGEGKFFLNPATSTNFFQAGTPSGQLVVMAANRYVISEIPPIRLEYTTTKSNPFF